MPKAKHPCSQTTKAKSKPGWLISFLWASMRDITWPVCISPNMEPQRRKPFISPDTVSLTQTVLIISQHLHASRSKWDLNMQASSLTSLQTSHLSKSWTTRLLCKAATVVNPSYTDLLSRNIIRSRKCCSESKAKCQSTTSSVKGGVYSIIANLNNARKHLYTLCAVQKPVFSWFKGESIRFISPEM